MDPIFFDTDCLNTFFRTGQADLLFKLYAYNIFLPVPVYKELWGKYKIMVDKLYKEEIVGIEPVDVDEEVYVTYCELIQTIGKGEAGGLALAKRYHGILASNNLKDVKKYVREYHIPLLTTADILVEAFNNHLLSQSQANAVWGMMIRKGCLLGAPSFTAYLRNQKTGKN